VIALRRVAGLGLIALLSSACLGPVSEDPRGERVPLPDGGFDLICGDGGVYGVAVELTDDRVRARNGAPPVFSKACTHVRGTLDVSGEIDFTPYQNVRVVEADLLLGFFPIQDINLLAFSNTRFVRRLSISETVGRLKSLEGLNLEGVFGGGIQILITPGLKDITALKRTNVRGGDLVIQQTDLESLDGLQGVTRVGRLSIADNRLLKDLVGLNNLARVDGDVDLRGNPQLRGVDAFLSRIEVAGTVYR
jgi:hypothetical protein